METLKCIESRRSIRKFEARPVEDDTIREIVKAAQLAPSWKNVQATRYTVLSDDNKKAVEDMLMNQGSLGQWNANIVKGCPRLLAISSVKKQSGHKKDGTPDSIYGESYSFFDSGLAVENFCLAANDKGLGTIIMGFFDYAGVSQLIELPENEEIIVLLGVGYPDEAPNARPRKATEEVLRFK